MPGCQLTVALSAAGERQVPMWWTHVISSSRNKENSLSKVMFTLFFQAVSSNDAFGGTWTTKTAFVLFSSLTRQ